MVVNFVENYIPMFKVKVPYLMVDFCYQDYEGNMNGYMIRVCNSLLNGCLHLPVVYLCEDNFLQDNCFDCIINQNRDNVDNYIFEYSECVLDTIPIYKIGKKNRKISKKNTGKIGAIEHGVLFYWMKKDEIQNVIFVDSALKLLEMLDAQEIEEIIIIKSYLKELEHFLLIQKKLKSDYTFELIDLYKIEPIYFIFNHKSKWVIPYINKYLPINFLL